jgi:hypothetical protein
MKGLTDKYETDELHIPNKVSSYYYSLLSDCYNDPKFNCYFIMNFFKGPLFEASQTIQKMAKFNGYKTFLVPKSLKQKLQHLKA